MREIKVKFFEGADLDKLEKEVNEFIGKHPDYYVNVQTTIFAHALNMYLITVTLTPITIVRQIVDDIEMPF